MSRSTLICGLKLTHDGAVAVIRDGRLLFSTETEKVANNARHSALRRTDEIQREIAANDVDPAEVDAVAIDGWIRRHDDQSYVELETSGGGLFPLDVAGYADDPEGPDGPPEATLGSGLPLAPLPAEFASYTHATGHLFASYSTSPYAAAGRPSLIVVWDGGMPPMLYAFHPDQCRIRRLGRVSGFSGALYPIFASHFTPFRVDRTGSDPDRAMGMEPLFPVSGKAMAYAALGKPHEEAIDVMDAVTGRLPEIDSAMRSYMWSRLALAELGRLDMSDAEVLASFQEYLFRKLLAGLRRLLDRHPELRGLPLCLSGGCALNIKWNAGLRACGTFDEVWVPPFPNDAGSAIGTACAEMVRRTGRAALEWSPFAGPDVRWDGTVPIGWSYRPCSVDELARLLHVEGEPVVVISGRAELGPRALGHRSIIAPATSAAMRDTLNRMKRREWYRPVAPICLEEFAPAVFAPGTPDPYMLFDHGVRPGWVERIPAVVHVDGSARLQTVGPSNAPTYELLRAYHRLSGIPVLCNTSANFGGRGFFPDPGSAMRWGETRYVWWDETLYFRR